MIEQSRHSLLAVLFWLVGVSGKVFNILGHRNLMLPGGFWFLNETVTFYVRSKEDNVFENLTLYKVRLPTLWRGIWHGNQNMAQSAKAKTTLKSFISALKSHQKWSFLFFNRNHKPTVDWHCQGRLDSRPLARRIFLLKIYHFFIRKKTKYRANNQQSQNEPRYEVIRGVIRGGDWISY